MAKSKRINFTIHEDNLKKLDDYAKEMNLSRSTAIAVIVIEYLKSKENINTLSHLVSIYNENKDKI